MIISPSAPTTAMKIGEEADDIVTKYMSDILTTPINLAGVPAISVPCGFCEWTSTWFTNYRKPFR